MKTIRMDVWRARVMAAAGALVLGVVAACSTNPATGRSQFNALSPDQEVQMGREAAPELVKEYGGAVPDAQLQAYVTEVGMRLAAATEGDNPKLPWKFTLLNSDVINAFALPGGQVFISAGLARQMTDEAQLAGVLGHEVGHVTARHINDQMTNTLLVGAAVEIAAGIASESENAAIRDVAPVAVNLGGQSVLLRFGRKQELEADALGVRYMARNQYDPTAQIDVMRILERAMGSGRSLEFFSTHPYPETRVAALERLIGEQYGDARTNPQYKRNAEQFRSRFLDRLSGACPEGRLAGGGGAPAPWCALCAAGEQGRAGPGGRGLDPAP